MVEGGSEGGLSLEQQPRAETRLLFPHALNAAEAYLAYRRSDPVNRIYKEGKVIEERRVSDQDIHKETETLHDILDEFLKVELENVRLYTRKDGEASVPYTSINVTEFARRVAERFEIQLPGILTQTEETTKEMQRETFAIYPSTTMGENGHPFAYVEVAMIEAMRHLGPVLKALEEGKLPPKDLQIVTMGAATNTNWGQISESYAERIKQDAFGTAGETYAELLENSGLLEGYSGKDVVRLWGTSMGCSFAAKTAEKLLADNFVTQSQEDRKDGAHPYLQIRMDAPAGVQRSDQEWSFLKKGMQIGGGFVIEGINMQLHDPHTRELMSKEQPFLRQVVEPELAKNNIVRDTDPKHMKLKGNAVTSTMFQLAHGVQLNRDLQAYLVRGFEDLTTKSKDDRPIEDKIQRLEKGEEGGVLNAVLNPQEKLHEYGIHSSHNIPFFWKDNGNEMRKWAPSVRTVMELMGSEPASA